MPRLIVHETAKGDLVKIRTKDPDAAADILTFLQEVEGDLDLLDRLTDRDFASERVESIDWIRSLQKSGLNVWRCKLYALESSHVLPYRIIYAFDRKTHNIWILAIAPRKELQNYDVDNPYIQRAATSYQSLGLPPVPMY